MCMPQLHTKSSGLSSTGHSPAGRRWVAWLSLPYLILSLMLAFPGIARAQYTESTIYTFSSASDGYYPSAGLVADSSGNLYGTTYYGGATGNGTVFELSPPSGGSGSWTKTILYSFTGNNGDGAFPGGPVTFDSQGNLYGVTFVGGSGGCSSGCGAVYQLTPSGGGSWTETVLYSFTGGTDGSNPTNALIVDSQGNLYGTTSESQYCDISCSIVGGAVFELSPVTGGGSWTETTLFQFTADDEGQNANGVIFDSSGNLYGITGTGGNNSNCHGGGCGVVYELSLSGGVWSESLLNNFTGVPGGGVPAGTLLLDSTENLYGTTQVGGATDSTCEGYGCGVVYELGVASAWSETVLHGFTGVPDGAIPSAGLIMDSQGSLFGTTYNGGSDYDCQTNTGHTGCGTVFELSPAAGGGSWTETVLYAFSGGSDGANPTAPLLLDSKGNLYGTTQYGGSAGDGVVFELSPVTPTVSTTTALSLAPSGVSVGSTGPVVMMATVSAGSGSGTPGGIVTFFNGSKPIESAELNNGGASVNYNPSSLAAGSYSITAVYGGQGNYLGSTSSAQMLYVVTGGFSISANPTSITISAPGGTGQTTITVTPSGGFAGTVSFGASSCSGLPSGASCSFNPSNVTVSGTTKLTIATTAASSSISPRPARGHPAIFLGLLVPCVFLGRGRKRNRFLVLALVAAVLLGLCLMALSGCGGSGGGNGGGGGGGGSTPSGTYTIIVTGTSSGLSSSTNITLVVQ
jgi:uncharacterized repeat protein (TIGR03803 family)